MKKLIFLLSLIPSIALCVVCWKYQLEGISLMEAIGFVTGAYAVWLTVDQNVWNFPIGIANNIAFFILFMKSRLFADASLQVVYAVLEILGWYWWLYAGQKARLPTLLPVRRITLNEIVVLLVLTVLATWQMDIYLIHIKDAAPFADAFTTVLSLVAQYLLTWKVFENWYVWIFADVIYVWLYAVKHLHLTSVLYALFLGLCFIGVRQWLQSYRKQQADGQVLAREGPAYVG